MFADCALPQDGYLIEYGFAEPPKFVTADHPRGFPGDSFSAPSLHFRHGFRVNVIWCDGHVSSERFDWAPDENVYGGDNGLWGVGWFGPRDNSYFDTQR